TVSAMRAAPQPYWRGRVSENMMYHPDIVTEKILHGLLAGRGLDLCLHFRCAGLLVAFLSKRGSRRVQWDASRSFIWLLSVFPSSCRSVHHLLIAVVGREFRDPLPELPGQRLAR